MQKGPQRLFPPCCEPEMAVPGSREVSLLLFTVWQPEQTNCAALDNERGDITNLFAHPNAGCNRTELISSLCTSDGCSFGQRVCF